jgi:hypothetical protein
MKMMWFTLWSEPTGVAAGDGVGVGPPELRPSPAHPVRRNSNRKARTHASDTLLQRVIGPTLERWRFAVAATTDGFEQQLTFIPSDVFSLPRVG